MPFTVLEPEQKGNFTVLEPEGPIQKMNETSGMGDVLESVFNLPDKVLQGVESYGAKVFDSSQRNWNAMLGNPNTHFEVPVGGIDQNLNPVGPMPTGGIVGGIPNVYQRPGTSVFQENPSDTPQVAKAKQFATPGNILLAIAAGRGASARVAGGTFGYEGGKTFLTKDVPRLFEPKTWQSPDSRQDLAENVLLHLSMLKGGAHAALHETRIGPQETPKGATRQRTVHPDETLGTAHDVVSEVAADKNSPYQGLAQQMLSQADQLRATPVHVDPTTGAAGEYDAATRRVSVHPNKVGNDFALLHEISHRLTNEKLKSSFAKEMKTLFEKVREKVDEEEADQTHGLRNLDEFTAEALTNPGFQQQLKFMRGEGRGVVDKGLDVALDLIGRARTKGSMLEKVAPEAQGIMNKQVGGMLGEEGWRQRQAPDPSQAFKAPEAPTFVAGPRGPQGTAAVPLGARGLFETQQPKPPMGLLRAPALESGPTTLPKTLTEAEKLLKGEQADLPTKKQTFRSGMGADEDTAKMLLPAVKFGGHILTGKQGDTHAEILERNGIGPDVVPHSSADRGFLLNGEWLSRQQAAEKIGKTGTADVGGIDSMDLPNAGKFRALRSAGMSKEEVSEILGDDAKFYSGVSLDELQKDIKRFDELVGLRAKLSSDPVSGTSEDVIRSRTLREIGEIKSKYSGLTPRDVYRQERGLSKNDSLYSGLPAGKLIREELNKLKVDYVNFRTSFSSKERELKDVISAKRDAVDNAPAVTADRADSHLKLEATRLFGKKDSEVAEMAANVYLEAEGDISKLPRFKAQSVTGKYTPGSQAVDFAKANWAKVETLAKEAVGIDNQNLANAKAAGVDIPNRDYYVKRSHQTSDTGRFTKERFLPGTGKSSLLPRQFPTIFDAIQNGLKPRTLKVSELVSKRTQEIYQDINQRLYAEAFKKTSFGGKPVSVDLLKTGQAPEGYVKVKIGDQSIAVLHGFDRIFNALEMPSALSNTLGGRALLEGIGGVKHGTLAFDTFHLSRIYQFHQSLHPGGRPVHGLSLLEVSAKDLDEAIKQGWYPESARAYQAEIVDMPQGKFTRRQLASQSIKDGLGIGRHSEALYSSFVREFPVLKQTVGWFHKLVFDEVTRGALEDAYQIEVERVGNEQPKWTLEQVSRSVARDLNFRMGAIGRQGLFKNKNFQDILQVIFLAPRWVESMAQSEVRSMGQAAQSMNPMSDRFGKRPTLLRSISNLLASYIVATQVLNIATTGHPTWKNDEDHQLDLYIPPFKKGGKGFWVSPLSVVAELTHDVMRYHRQGKGKVETLRTIGENKLSNVGRAIDVGLTGGPMNRGEPNPGDAATELFNPTPLPFRQATKAAKEKDIVPFERQAFAMAGFKAEPETGQEVRDREVPGKTMKERIAYEKERKASAPLQGGTSKVAAAERSIEANVKRGKDVLSGISKANRQWIESRGLSMPGFDNKIREGGTSVYLTKDEMKKMETYVKEAVEEKMEIVRRKPDVYSQQKNFSELMSSAHAKARSRIIKEIKSHSENESNNNRYSAFRP